MYQLNQPAGYRQDAALSKLITQKLLRPWNSLESAVPELTYNATKNHLYACKSKFGRSLA